jgi:hypothetical protein
MTKFCPVKAAWKKVVKKSHTLLREEKITFWPSPHRVIAKQYCRKLGEWVQIRWLCPCNMENVNFNRTAGSRLTH